MFRIVPAPGQCSINISDHHDCFEEHDREDTRTEKGRDNEWRSQRAAAREAGEPRLTHPVLRHTGLELLDLAVWHPGPRAVPIFFLLPALALQLLELQVHAGPRPAGPSSVEQKDWRPGPLRTRRVEGWSHDSWTRREEGLWDLDPGVLRVRGLGPELLGGWERRGLRARMAGS